MVNYEIWLTTDTGVRLKSLNSFLTFEASQEVNNIGSFAMTMPLSFDPNLIAVDRMVQIWRQPTGGALGLWRTYIIRRFKFWTSGSQQNLMIAGPDMLDLLRRRIVAAYAGSAQAEKTDYADDMMKEVVTESIADGVAPTPDAGTRVWSDLSVQADASLGPSITKSFSFSQLLTASGQGALGVIAKAARENGTEIFFDIVPNAITPTSATWQFQTKIDQPGRNTGFVFSQEKGNLKDPSLEYDYTDEENYIYTAGQGEGEARVIAQSYDADRYGVSQWGRCEGFADARNETTPNGVQAVADSALSDGRPRIRFSGQPVDTAQSRFGLDWNFGDKVTAKYLNRQFTVIIRAITLSVNDNGEETVQTRLDYEAAL